MTIRTSRFARSAGVIPGSTRRCGNACGIRWPTGRGWDLLFFFPPMLWVLSLPIFDIIAVLQPITKANWALGLMVVPVMIPVVFSFLMIFGYAIVFLGHVLVASSLGENDHPSWPEWHPADIAEGFGRWIWAMVVGLLVGCRSARPLLVQLRRDRRVRLPGVCRADHAGGRLCADGTGGRALAREHRRGQPDHGRRGNRSHRMALSLAVPAGRHRAGLHRAGTLFGLLYKMPRMWMEAVALWAYWVLVLYLGMVVDPHDGADLPRTRPRPGVVQAPAPVGDVETSRQAVCEFVSAQQTALTVLQKSQPFCGSDLARCAMHRDLE